MLMLRLNHSVVQTTILFAACALAPNAWGMNQAQAATNDQIYIDSVPSGAAVFNLPRQDGQGQDKELGKTPLTVDLTTVQSMRFAVMMGVDEYLKQIKPLPELRDFSAKFRSSARIIDNSNSVIQQYFDFGTGTIRSTRSKEGALISFGTVYDLTVVKALRLCPLFVPLGADRRAYFPLMPQPGSFLRQPGPWLERFKSQYHLSDEDASTAVEYLVRAGAYVMSIKDPLKEGAVSHVSITVAPDGTIQQVTRGNSSAGAGRPQALPPKPGPLAEVPPPEPGQGDSTNGAPQSHYSTEVRASARREYEAALKRVQDGDMTVNFRKFRLDATLMTDSSTLQAQRWESEDRATFKRFMDAGGTEAALDSANQSLTRNYASIAGHVNAMAACLKLNRAAEAAVHSKILTALLDSIQRSGDGKSQETAWFVTTIPEEYALLAYRLHMTRKSQGITAQGSHFYDRLEVTDAGTGQNQTVWFNTDVDMGKYAPVLRTPEFTGKLQRLLPLYISGQLLNALPLTEELAVFDPEDATLQMILADCLLFKSGTNVTPEEALELRSRAREKALRAFQLGDNSTRLAQILSLLASPKTLPPPRSVIPEADRAMRDGEQALGIGDYDRAIAAYSDAFKLDRKLYQAAMYAGDISFTKREFSNATEWFEKAADASPGNATVYVHWGDGLMMAGNTAGARDKYIEAVIAQPTPGSWIALTNWAKRANSQVAPPKIDRPEVNAPGSPWAGYFSVRAMWRQSTFAQKHPAETEYRHTLEEEAEALSAMAPQVGTLADLKNAGLLESWILLSGSDAGIARDYAGYRAAHHEYLRTYIEKYVIRPNK